MEALLGEVPEMDTWFEWKAVEKIRSTYGKSFLDRITPEGRIHGSFNPFGAATGRFSSSSPNLQNIPSAGSVAHGRVASSGAALTIVCS